MQMMEQFYPKVSIVIPVYNGSDYMREAIDSALGQTYGNIEVIVVNDGSSDGGLTHEIALSYGGNIRYFAKENGGVASALNFAIRMMDGEYFSWLSHDDIYYPNKIETQIGYLAEHDRNAILYSDFELIDCLSKVIKPVNAGEIPPEQFLYNLITIGHLNGCTLLVPKRCFEETGFFDESLRSTQDYALWFTFAQKYRFEQIRKVLVKYRTHSNQGSYVIPTHSQEVNDLHIWFLEEASERGLLPIPDEGASRFFLEVAGIYKKRGIYRAADYSCSMALRHMRDEGGLALLRELPRVAYLKYYFRKKQFKSYLRELRRSTVRRSL
ncbi:glycosyltransferase [Geobacter sulfurreducens]|uniref:Glycosyltransferase n=1 Tax=Geobacter sulfurreducens (strain ATCC 51573 / DSM 12127 / PCA) TaxID=243231 RepID=Q74AV6_GEOSL|nr:glycosyltransferase [Geobacter sulfurreducens PCA]ADN78363.1 glycosyltransferase [Geobacter sulfurreducens KN400]UAC05838.1 glycosyltransferase [Geobacter sulfurreducens]HBB69459.1 glycosyl transferase [Geobacter sulfurreducens]HCD95007.1 glycosyl transferase [Geobacter sulfurreducens]